MCSLAVEHAGSLDACVRGTVLTTFWMDAVPKALWQLQDTGAGEPRWELGPSGHLPKEKRAVRPCVSRPRVSPVWFREAAGEQGQSCASTQWKGSH